MTGLNLTPIEQDDVGAGIPGAPGNMPAGPPDLGGVSLLEQAKARLKQRGSEVEQDNEQLFALPKYEGLLVARYRKLHWTDAEKIREAGANTIADYSADFLIAACIEILIATEDGETHQPFPYPLTFTHDLLDLVDRPHGNSARENLQNLFAGDDMMWIEHSGVVGDWMRTGSNEGAFLGKSSRPTSFISRP